MRIDRLEVRNFKKFAEQTIEFTRPPNALSGNGSFHLLIGENGAGKTSVLDAMAVALSIWLEKPPDSLLDNSYRHLTSDQKRLTSIAAGDREQFQQAPGEMAIRSRGTMLGHTDISWGQALEVGKKKVSLRDSKQALALVAGAYDRTRRGEHVLLPVISYYGAGRAWLPHNERRKFKEISNEPANRWEAFYDCLNDRIRISDLNGWFRSEAIERGNRGGRYRPGFDIVLKAVCGIIPGANAVSYDSDRQEIVLSIDGQRQPFSNLSAGQRSLFALVADIAIKVVTQNNYLVPADALTSDDEPLPRVLACTPGVVLIDELDVHLHPKWQRGIATALKRIFPEIQFVTTTHSPQIIGGVQPEEICRLLPDGGCDMPAQSFGMDTNWILQVLMDADEQEPEVKQQLDLIFKLIADRKLDEAQDKVHNLRRQIGNSEALQRAASTIERIRMINR